MLSDAIELVLVAENEQFEFSEVEKKHDFSRFMTHHIEFGPKVNIFDQKSIKSIKSWKFRWFLTLDQWKTMTRPQNDPRFFLNNSMIIYYHLVAFESTYGVSGENEIKVNIFPLKYVFHWYIGPISES